jgi:hypothetical protein
MEGNNHGVVKSHPQSLPKGAEENHEMLIKTAGSLTDTL